MDFDCDPPRYPPQPGSRIRGNPASLPVADHLRQWGLEVTEGMAKTGVVATLKGRQPRQRAIGLRVDLDALHIQETFRKIFGKLSSRRTPPPTHAQRRFTENADS